MEILFMVFMVVVSIMALFAVMVVFRDIVKEILVSRRERDRAAQNAVAVAQPVSEAPAPVAEALPEEEPTAPVEEALTETAEEAAASEVAEAEEEAAEENDGTISFSMGQRQTLEEKYLALSSEQKGWYDEIIKYAAAVDGSKRFKNVRYEEYKIGKNRLVRMLIKRGIIHCEFILHNSDFKNYINENRISVRQSATTMLVESVATVEAAKNSIDIVVAAIAEEKEYKKKLARERRRAARANGKASKAAAEASSEAPVEE